MDGLILFSYKMLSERNQLPQFYEHLFHGKMPEGYVEKKMPLYEAYGLTDPLTHYTQSIAASLENEQLNVYHGCKHTEPFVEQAVEQAIKDGCQTIYMLALMPLQSKTGTIAYEQKVQKYLQQHAPQIKAVSLNDFGQDPRFVALLTTRVKEALTYTQNEPTVIFTAHSLPGTMKANEQFIKQYEALAVEIVSRLDEKLDYRIAYRSVGDASQKWLRPDILDVLDEEYQAGTRAVLVCELLSIIENMEVLDEIGMQAKEKALQLGMDFIQMRYLNDSYLFVSFLQRFLQERLT